MSLWVIVVYRKGDNMNIVDLHTHTTFSDGDATMEQLLEAANRKGYKIGVSDHAFCKMMTTQQSIDNYLEQLKKYDVYKGVEGNIGDYTKWSDRILSKLDYVIASVHTFYNDPNERLWLANYFGYRCGHVDEYKQIYDKKDSRPIMDEIIQRIENTFIRTKVDILGHSTVLPFYDDLEGSEYLYGWEEEVLSLCKKYNVAIEISGLWKAPNLAFIKRAMEKGLMFTLGSDGHRLNELCNLDYALGVVDELKIPEDRMFVPVKL